MHLFRRLLTLAAALLAAAPLVAQTIAVDPESYAPSWPDQQRNIPFAFDKKTGSLLTLPTGPLSQSGAVLVGNTKSKIRDEFATGGLSALWQTVETGSGQSITTGNGTTGSYLLIASGTTINAQTTIRSVASFTLPVRLAVFATASQRIANTELFIELIEVDAAGAPVLATPTQTNAGDYRNHVAVKFAGTSATTADITVRSGAAPEFVSTGATITTTAATGSGPNWFPAGYVELQATGEHAALVQAAIDSTSAATVARRITQAAPSPDALYKLQIRLRNLGTAPASSTDWRIHALRLFDYTRLTAEVIGGNGHGGAAMAVPVNIAGGSVAATGTLTGVTTVTTLTTLTGSGVAEDAATTANPLVVGGVVRTALPPATLAAGDAMRISGSTSGQVIIKPWAPRDLDFQVATTITTATQTAIRAAQAAGIRQNITSITYQNTNATATLVTIQDASTTLIQFNAPASMANPVQLDFPQPLYGTAAAALNYTAGTTGANVLLQVTGFNSY